MKNLSIIEKFNYYECIEKYGIPHAYKYTAVYDPDLYNYGYISQGHHIDIVITQIQLS